jgi:hypothetical protein
MDRLQWYWLCLRVWADSLSYSAVAVLAVLAASILTVAALAVIHKGETAE